MAGISVAKLRDRHVGQDVWVIASGPSAEFVDPAFFDGKVTIGVNRIWDRFRTTYLVVKERQILLDAIKTGAQVIASRHSCGSVGLQLNETEADFYIFDHQDNRMAELDLELLREDQIVASRSTITSAIHLAAHMGANPIILVGHDCGTLDDRLNFDGYPEPLINQEGFYESFLGSIEPATIELKAWLKERYGCDVYSLNPFINFGLEGHRYERLAEEVVA